MTKREFQSKDRAEKVSMREMFESGADIWDMVFYLQHHENKSGHAVPIRGSQEQEKISNHDTGNSANKK